MTRRILQVLLMCLATASPAAAQHGPIYLQPGHWAWDAIRRLNALGVAPAGSDPATAPVTLQHARAVFEGAAATARLQEREDIAELAVGYGRLLERAEGAPGEFALRAGVGGARITGELLTGEFMVTPWAMKWPEPLPPVRGPVVTVGGHGPMTRRISLHVEAALLGSEPVLPAAYAGAAAGPFDMWVGRQRVHYGAGRGGGVVSGNGWIDEPLIQERSTLNINGAGVAVREPFQFPGFLRILGTARIEVAGGRLEAVGEAEGAFLVLGRLTGTPFSQRFTLGLNRGAVFGGSGRPLTTRRLLGVLLGSYQEDAEGTRSGFENQVASGIMRYRPPTERLLPLELYLEFGADDMAGAIRDSPALVGGVDLPTLPGLPAVALTLEHARFLGGEAPRVRLWYINFPYGGAWSDAGRNIAHPMGGIGREWLARAAYAEPASGLQLSLTGFTRYRDHLDMYYPFWYGRSHGLTMNAAVHTDGRWSLRAFGFMEQGEEWRSGRAVVRAEYRVW